MAHTTEADLNAAKARWREERAFRPTPLSVRYDRDSKNIVIYFEHGAIFMVPSHKLEGLHHAADDDLAAVELLGETGLHWEKLDVDYTIAGLLSGLSLKKD
jgi:hypothetical protein